MSFSTLAKKVSFRTNSKKKRSGLRNHWLKLYHLILTSRRIVCM